MCNLDKIQDEHQTANKKTSNNPNIHQGFVSPFSQPSLFNSQSFSGSRKATEGETHYLQILNPRRVLHNEVKPTVQGEDYQTKKPTLRVSFSFRREDKIRTCDPLHPIQVRYRAAPLPELLGCKNNQISDVVKFKKVFSSGLGAKTAPDLQATTPFRKN